MRKSRVDLTTDPNQFADGYLLNKKNLNEILFKLIILYFAEFHADRMSQILSARPINHARFIIHLSVIPYLLQSIIYFIRVKVTHKV